MSRLDEARILDSTPGELRERLAIRRNTLGLQLEAALLGHRGIPSAHGIRTWRLNQRSQGLHVIS